MIRHTFDKLYDLFSGAYFVKTDISQDKLDLFLNNWAQKVSLGKSSTSLSQALYNEGFSSNLSNLSFSASSLPKGSDLSNIKFNNVVFEGNFNASNLNSDFNYCSFNNNIFNESNITQAKINNCVFLSNTLDSTTINNSDITNSWFIDTKFSASTIIDNKISNSVFSFPKPLVEENTIGRANPLEAKSNVLDNTGVVKGDYSISLGNDTVNKSLIIDDALPTVGMIGSSQWGDSACNKLRDLGCKINFLDYKTVENVNNSQLEYDVKLARKTYDNYAKFRNNYQNKSFVEYLIHSDSFESVNKIKTYAKQYIQKSDAIWIPGAVADVHPIFYGQKKMDINSS
jgi:hypothetical protein